MQYNNNKKHDDRYRSENKRLKRTFLIRQCETMHILGVEFFFSSQVTNGETNGYSQNFRQTLKPLAYNYVTTFEC